MSRSITKYLFESWWDEIKKNLPTPSSKREKLRSSVVNFLPNNEKVKNWSEQESKQQPLDLRLPSVSNVKKGLSFTKDNVGYVKETPKITKAVWDNTTDEQKKKTLGQALLTVGKKMLTRGGPVGYIATSLADRQMEAMSELPSS